MATTLVAPSVKLASELGDYRAQLDDCLAGVGRLTGELSESNINWQPEPTRWSVAQCLDHPNKATATYIQAPPPPK